jgi:NADH-quinone oxidoreductase subunit N
MDVVVLKSFIPEFFLILFILLFLVLNLIIIIFVNKTYICNHPIIVCEIHFQCVFILCCMFFLCYNNKIEGFLTNFVLLNDSGSNLIKLFLIGFSIFILFPISKSFKVQTLSFFEYYILFLFSVLSSLLLLNVSNFISVYLVIELQSLCFYVLSCFRRKSCFSTESGLKYFILGCFISGIFIFGCSILFGLLGTLNFYDLNLLLSISFSENNNNIVVYLLFAFFLIISVLLFKVSAVPFHFWSPDVYEGSPISSTIIFSIVPKFSLFYLFFKWLLIIPNFFQIILFLQVCGILSILVGSFFALRQKGVKRLLIYSSIAQVGFLISALSTYTFNGFVGIFFFLIIYLLTSILVWINFSLLFDFQSRIKVFNNVNFITPLYLSSLSSFFFFNRLWPFSNLLIFFSLAGIPPMVGFFSKTLIIFSLVDNGFLFLSFILLLVSSISVFYYLRVLKNFFFEKFDFLNFNFSHGIFKSYLFNSNCLLISFLLFCLIYFFFCPLFLVMVCCLIFSNSFFF